MIDQQPSLSRLLRASGFPVVAHNSAGDFLVHDAGLWSGGRLAL